MDLEVPGRLLVVAGTGGTSRRIESSRIDHCARESGLGTSR